jgi:hypothetical protein
MERLRGGDRSRHALLPFPRISWVGLSPVHMLLLTSWTHCQGTLDRSFGEVQQDLLWDSIPISPSSSKTSSKIGETHVQSGFPPLTNPDSFLSRP